MAFIRRVRTASGATGVQIAGYVRGRQRIVEHVGSAHTEAELGVLLERARELLENPAQGVLELGVEPIATVKGLIAPAGEPGLFDIAGTAPPPGRTGPARVDGTDSRVLFTALAGVFTTLGFDGLSDEVFDGPGDRPGRGTYLAAGFRQGPAGPGPCPGRLRDDETHPGPGRCGQIPRPDRGLVLPACQHQLRTSPWCSTTSPGCISRRRRKTSCERSGTPRNAAKATRRQTATIIPVIKQFQARHSLADLVVVADAGMLSEANLRELDEAGLRFIVGSRMTKAPNDLASHFGLARPTRSATGN